MRFKKKNLVAVMSCVMMFAAAPLLPAQLSIIASAHAKDGGGAVSYTHLTLPTKLEV